MGQKNKSIGDKVNSLIEKLSEPTKAYVDDIKGQITAIKNIFSDMDKSKKNYFIADNEESLQDLFDKFDNWKKNCPNCKGKEEILESAEKSLNVIRNYSPINISNEDSQQNHPSSSTKKPNDQPKGNNSSVSDKQTSKPSSNPHPISGSKGGIQPAKDIGFIKSELGNLKKSISEEITREVKKIDKSTLEIKKSINTAKDEMNIKLMEISRQEKILKDIQEAVEPISAKMKKFNDSIEDVGRKVEESLSGSSAKLNELPKDEKSVLELTRYMRDGLNELENIARYYVQKEAEFSKAEDEAKKQDEAVQSAKEEGRSEGAKEAEKKIAQELYKQHPTDFEKIYTIFGDLVVVKYNVGDMVSVNADNRQELEIEIEGISEESDYIIDSPAYLLDGEVLKKATVHKNETKE